jgi:ankyrin repeat protein
MIKIDAIDAVIYGHYGQLLSLLKSSSLDPNYSEDGVTLLHYAMLYEKIDIANLLITWGADFNQKDLMLNESAYELATKLNYDRNTLKIFTMKHIH